MPDRFHESDTENAPECIRIQRVIRIQEQSLSDPYTEPCKQNPIRYQTESDTLVIWYRVNGP